MTGAAARVSMPAAMAADFLWQLDAVSLAPARLHEVSVTIPRGATAVIGWSGAGKTSLLDLLAAEDNGRLGGVEIGARDARTGDDDRFIGIFVRSLGYRRVIVLVLGPGSAGRSDHRNG